MAAAVLPELQVAKAVTLSVFRDLDVVADAANRSGPLSHDFLRSPRFSGLIACQELQIGKCSDYLASDSGRAGMRESPLFQ